MRRESRIMDDKQSARTVGSYYPRWPSRKDRFLILAQLVKDDRLSREVSIDHVGVHYVDGEQSRQLGGARRPRARG